MSGTTRHMSKFINIHLGQEQSRQDNFESLGHVFMHLLHGHLPWQGIIKSTTTSRRCTATGEKKQVTSVAELCARFPEEITTYMSHVRDLGFEDTRDTFLSGLFTKLLEDAGEVNYRVMGRRLLDGGAGWEASVSVTKFLIIILCYPIYSDR
ncbi:hypothetical protein ACGC1H_006783 [Rhizoctonia solani]